MRTHVGLAVLGLVCLMAVAPAASPVQLSYVYSGSMEPTIGQFDGYVLVHTTDVDVGDVVTFWSPARDSWVTHRIVGESDRGYITQGDANPSTDQAAGFSYVTDEEIRGRVLTVQGSPLVVPALGEFVRAVRDHAVSLVAVFGIALVATLFREGNGRPSRSVPRSRDVLWPVFAVAVLSAVGLQTFGGHTQQFSRVAVDGNGHGADRLVVGEPGTETVVVQRSTLPLTTQVIGARGMTLTNQTRNDTTVTATFRIPPPRDRGVVETTVVVDSYPTVLPPVLIRRLHRIHPVLASAATVGVSMLPVALATVLLVDGNQPLRPTKSRTWRVLTRWWRDL